MRPRPGSAIIFDSDTLGHASGISNRCWTTPFVGGKQDYSVCPPASPVRIGGGGEINRVAARNRNFLELVPGKETNPLTIWRKEGAERAVRPWNRHCLQLVQHV